MRQVAAKVGVPRSTVGGYFAGRSLPTVALTSVLPRILRELGVTEPAPWERALARLRRAPGPVPVTTRRDQSSSNLPSLRAATTVPVAANAAK